MKFKGGRVSFGTFITLLVYMLLVYKIPTYAQSEFTKPFGVASVTAKFIYNLIDYVIWKNKNEDSTIICTINGKDIGDILIQISNSPDFKQKITVYNDIKTYEQCHILYVGNGYEIEKTLKAVKGKNILTVSDIKGFASRGGAVGFDYSTASVSMQANLNTLKSSNLMIDAELLGLMEIID